MTSRSSVHGIALTTIALLEDQSGQWVIANDKLCDSAGTPTRTIPAQLGTVCGVQ